VGDLVDRQVALAPRHQRPAFVTVFKNEPYIKKPWLARNKPGLQTSPLPYKNDHPVRIHIIR
jgi:hypothetical protein